MEFLKKHSSIIVFALIVAFGAYHLGYKAGEERLNSNTDVLGANEDKPNSLDFSPFWRAWNLINEKYVSASTTAEQVSDEEKLYGALKGLANSLGDPYTVFLPPVENEMFESDIRGNFEGVGMEVLAQQGAITVISPLKNSPAERAGIEAGDRVIRINGDTTNGLTTEDAVQLIRGERGTAVNLTIFREGVAEPFEVSVIRDVINIPTINTRITEDIFVIELYSFSANSANLFRGALREFVSSGKSKLILDLRGNPGGYLDAAIDMASWFLPPSKVVVREDFGGRKDERVYRSRGYDIFNENLEFVILVDRGSASASEILAGALQEHGIAKIVGEQTFGKGSVQELVDLTSETSIKITIARWLTPKGVSISETGVTPDYVVNEDREAQFNKALEVLNQ